MRRGLVVENTMSELTSGRVIELPRRTIPKKVARILQKRHQIHARASPDIHIRLKMTAAQLDRTQQDVVASAIDAYSSFIDNDVRPLVSGGTNATD
ncbi:MAG: hypothetical protein CMM46_04865 [Rhodospirillaceae bacterium]|nr:hypothetical protein [Rhodospirillaceae bacterium]|tara:strand:+ start:1288 stop:1575 length:288 start_codon:yes stop_codon:yes gene_type:complete